MTPTCRVLIVDDEAVFRKNLARVLGQYGISSAEAPDGETALARAAAEAFDVVLLDLKMPGMDGTQTLKHLKAGGCTAEVIVLTGHASLEEAVALIAEGAFDYMLKPYESRELLELVNAAAEQKARREAGRA